MSATKILWAQVLIVSLIVLTTVWGATQWTAWRLGFQPGLVDPGSRFRGRADVFAASILLVVVRLRRLRSFDLPGGRGNRSFRRVRIDRRSPSRCPSGAPGSAGHRDIWIGTLGYAYRVRAAGAFGGKALMLRSFGPDYIRHDGPEHVLCFAPTRSGKGRQPGRPVAADMAGSAVHDIKEELVDAAASAPNTAASSCSTQPMPRQPLTIRCWSSGAANGGARRPERRGRPQIRGVRSNVETIGRRQTTRSGRRDLHVLHEADKTLAGVAAFLSDPRRLIETTLAMMRTAHLGSPHPVVASAARELWNKSDNERSGVLSTAMSFLGLYRDPVVAEVTAPLRLADCRLVDDPRRATLCIWSCRPRTFHGQKPLIRLILNQIGRP